jgi:small-conductance mechanosensitive channel
MEIFNELNFFNQNNLFQKILFVLFIGFTGFFFSVILFELVKISLKKTFKSSSESINKNLRIVFYIFFTLLFINIAIPASEFKGYVGSFVQKISFILFISCFAIMASKILLFAKTLIYERHDINIENNLSGRKIRTQIDFLYKLGLVVITLIAVSVILMSFKSVRDLGTSLLASAGIAGILIGFAAQKSIANLLAGFQIAFTQPIRLDDVVIVENEWGKIEEISLTYVVVRIWDARRLVLPISYFLEKPFQNWTRVSAELLGTIFLYADYSLPIDAVRAEVTRLLPAIKQWDGKVNVVQVTDTTERTMQIRILVSSRNSGEAFDLRCILREKVIDFIQSKYPGSLPKFRTETLAEESMLK